MAVTIYDVAKAAGVGISTVSRVLNESKNVRPETRQRVLKAIAELGYRPNPLARNLSRPGFLSVGVMLGFLTNPFQVAVLHGIQQVLSEVGPNLIVYSIDSAERRERLLHGISQGHRVDGLICVSFAPGPRHRQRLCRYNIPVAVADFRDPELLSVYVDNVQGGYLATRHLLEQGHRRIGYIQDVQEQPNGAFGNRPGQDRLEGYMQALAEAGLPVDPDLVVQADVFSREEGARAAASLLERPDPPTAIFACSDMLALGILEYARDRGLAVPDNLAVIGFDDIDLATFADLSTVRQPMVEMGRQAAQLLWQAMCGQPLESRAVEMPLELVVRRSTVR